MTIDTRLDRQLLRTVYGTFPVGVTVVTTLDGDGVLWGMTASSFCSISMDPPLVSVAVIGSTPSHDAFTGCDEFAISILNDQQGELARKFATPALNKFEGVDLTPAPYQSPILADASAWLACRREAVLRLGDHSLLVGRVLDCAVQDFAPLTYQRGTFFSLLDHPNRAAETIQLREHGTVAFIVEYESQIALARAENGDWTLPLGQLEAGPTIEKSLQHTARTVLGVDVTVDFLYSMVNLSENVTCSIYRARVRQTSARPSRVTWFADGDIPWDGFTNTALVAAARRYLKERVSDQFGVFVGLGGDRLATIRIEATGTEGVTCPTSAST